MLFRSNDEGATFSEHATLAERAIPASQFCMFGTAAASMLHRLRDDLAQIGDYVGLAATQERVAAAYVLPDTDDPRSTARIYVDVLSN